MFNLPAKPTLGFPPTQGADMNRRENKEVEKGSQYQARLFKQLSDEMQQINQVLYRPSTQDLSKSGGTMGDSNTIGSRYLGFSHGFGQRMGAGMESGRTIEQIYQNLKSKQDQLMTSNMDTHIDNESRMFFQDKSVDLSKLENSLRAAQTSLREFSSKQKIQKPLTIFPTAQPLFTSITTSQPLQLNKAGYKSKLMNNEQTSVKTLTSKKSLYQNFSRSQTEKFKLAAPQGKTSDREFYMPPPRQYGVKLIEEAKDKSHERPGFLPLHSDKDFNIIRDIPNRQSNESLLNKLLKSKAKLEYDEGYLRNLVNSFTVQHLPVLNEYYRPIFEVYMNAFKKYTEEKIYSEYKNLPGLIKSLFEYEKNLAQQDNNSYSTYLSDIWELIHFVMMEMERSEFTAEDRLLFSEKYQSVLAKASANYLENDFRKTINDQVGAFEVMGDDASKFEFYVKNRLFGTLNEESLSTVTRYVFEESPMIFPFATAFYMFRAGQHQIAIDYLKSSQIEEVRLFGEQYRKYFQVYDQSIPISALEQFYNDCEKLQISNCTDMYKSVLTHLMVGSEYQPPNSDIFYQILLPYELEIQLWLKFKVAAYEHKNDNISEYQNSSLPGFIKPHSLKALQDYITSQLGPDHFSDPDAPPLYSLVVYFKVLMLAGCYTQALESLYAIDYFKIQVTFIAVALKDIGVLRTRYEFLQHLPTFDTSDKEKLLMLFNETFDYQQHIYFMVHQLTQQNACPTEAICLILFLENPTLVIQGLANFIVKTSKYKLLLENDSEQSILDFQYNTNLTIRTLVKDDTYMKLVHRVVEKNENEPSTNILLLDKINQHEEVLKYMVRIQLQEIERKLPSYYVSPNQSDREFMELYNNLRSNPVEMQSAIKDHARLLNAYEKQQMKKKFIRHYQNLDTLDVIVNAYNLIFQQKLEDAITEFSQLTFLPMKRSDDISSKVREYQNLQKGMINLIFRVILTIAKAVRHINFKVTKETNQQSSTRYTETKQKRFDEYVELLSRLVLYLDQLKIAQIVDPDQLNLLHTVTKETKKIQVEIA